MTPRRFELDRFLPYQLNQAAEAVGAGFARHYRDRYGMLRNDWRVLSHLGTYGRMTARDIAARSKLHKTKISRAVARLEERRFLLRHRAETDRRLEYLELTRVGQAAFEDLRKMALAYDAEIEAVLGKSRAEALREILSELAMR